MVNIEEMDNYVKTFHNNRVEYLKQKVKEFTQARLAEIQKPITEQAMTG
ncbi:MAG: hypothetical protein LBC61_04475 [Candidatus Peribacteria bacterium]|nr:hypothetical protein [Candidatus Peribacteria bacterium]